MPGFSIAHTTRSYPRLPYEAIKNDVLGTSYMLSLVFVGPRRAQALNKRTRNKDYVPNVLSFEIDSDHGEIYITPAIAKKEARLRGMTERGYIGFLFIHGLLHLKGMPHGDRMDEAEQHYCTRYNLA